MWMHSGNPFVLQILSPPSFVGIMNLCLQKVKDANLLFIYLFVKDANLVVGTMAHKVQGCGCVRELQHKARVALTSVSASL